MSIVARKEKTRKKNTVQKFLLCILIGGVIGWNLDLIWGIYARASSRPPQTARNATCMKKEGTILKLTVKQNGVWLDEQKILNCTQIDIKNISPINGMEAVLHVHVDEADVRWAVISKAKLQE